MFSFLFSLPYLLLIGVFVADMLQQGGVIKTRFNFVEDFMLNSELITKVLNPVVLVWFIVMLINIFLPIGLIYSIVSFVVFSIAWYWLYKCYVNGKVQFWLEVFKK